MMCHWFMIGHLLLVCSFTLLKLSVMWFTPKPSKMRHTYPFIFVNSTQLQEVGHQKYLGIIFDRKLCWDNQLNDVCKWAAYYLHLLDVHQKSLT